MWFRAITLDIGRVGDALQWFDQEAIEASKEVALTGNAATLAALLPGMQSYRLNQYYELAAIVDHLEIKLKQDRASKHRQFIEHYNRDISSADATKWVEADPDIVDMAGVVNEVKFVRNQFLGFTKSLDAKKYLLGNIVSLHKAGIADLEI